MITSISVKANEAVFYIWKTLCKIVPEDQLVEIKTYLVSNLDSLNLPIPDQLQEAYKDFSIDFV